MQSAILIFQFSIIALRNFHCYDSLNIANLQSYSSREIPHGFPWAKMKISVGLYSFLEAVRGRFISLIFPAFKAHFIFSFLILFFPSSKPASNVAVFLSIFLGLTVPPRLSPPVFWPREFHGLYRPWGHKESNIIELLSLSF